MEPGGRRDRRDCGAPRLSNSRIPNLRLAIMAAAYIVEDPDPNNFVVIHSGEQRRYVFHVVPGPDGRILQPAAWTRQDAPPDHTEHFSPAIREFAEREARSLGLID